MADDVKAARRANLDAAAKQLKDEIESLITDAKRRKRAIAALQFVVEISAELMDQEAPHGRVTH